MAGVPIRTIIFDIGRVLVGIDIARAEAGLAKGLPVYPGDLWTAIERDARWQAWQEGRISPQNWHAHLCSKFGVSLSVEEFTKAWNEVLEPEPLHANSFFETLSKRYKLALLSNTDPIHVAKMESTYDFFNYFPPSRRIYSCAIGCTKPLPMTYCEALRACNSPAAEAVYVDDIPANLDAARELGLRGIVFKTSEQLREDLAVLGVQFQD